MNELIQKINNVAVLNTATINMLIDIDKKKKELEEAEKIIRNALLVEMRNEGIAKIESEELLINYIAPSDKESFDSKTFRAEHPDLYDNYVKMSHAKDSIRINIKDGKLDN